MNAVLILVTVEGWVDSLRTQIEHYLSFEGANGATIEQPGLDRWVVGPGFLRDIGKHFRVGTMVRKEIVASRLWKESHIPNSLSGLTGYGLYGVYRRTTSPCKRVAQINGATSHRNRTCAQGEGEHVHAIGTY